jgi:hypothetical protein
VLVVSALFEGQRNFPALCIPSDFLERPCDISPSAALIERQRSIYALLESEMKHIHALTLKCLTPAQYQP